MRLNINLKTPVLTQRHAAALQDHDRSRQPTQGLPLDSKIMSNRQQPWMDDWCVCRVLRMDSGKQPSPDRCRWFPGARLNIAHCALHSQRAVPCCPAMVWAEQDSPSVLHAMSIEQLRASVAQTAGSVLQLFKPGRDTHKPYPVHCVPTLGTVAHCWRGARLHGIWGTPLCGDRALGPFEGSASPCLSHGLGSDHKSVCCTVVMYLSRVCFGDRLPGRHCLCCS